MKAKHAFLVIALSVMALFCSCEESVDHATLRVNLRQDRSIVPEDFPLEIESYRITGDGPGSESFSIETNKETVSLEGLVIGEWVIMAEGLNSNKDVLVTGSTTHKLSATNGSCTIILEDLVGTGSLEVLLHWDPERISGKATVELELTPQYGEKKTETLELTSIDENDGNAQYSGTGYPSGSYVLAARLYDGKIQVAGFVEAVRIAGDQISKGEIRFDLDKYPIEPGTLELIDKTGVPVQCVIEGLTDTVDADLPVKVRITSETDDVSDYAIVWYLDGNHAGDGAEIEITPNAGTHRLDVVASTSRLGTAGSTSINFEAVSKALPGVPSHGNLVEDGEEIALSGTTVVDFLPDGNAMIVSNSERKVYVAAVVRSSLDVKMEYTFSDLGITGDVVDFDSTAVNSSLSKVVLAEENPLKVVVFNYNPTTTSLTKFSEGTPQCFSYPDPVEALEIDSISVIDAVKKDGCSVGIMTMKASDTNYWQYNYMSLTENTGSDDYFWQGQMVTMMSKANLAGDIVTTSESFCQFNTDGKGVYMLKTNSTSDVVNRAFYFNPPVGLESQEVKFNNMDTFTMLSPEVIMTLGDYINIIGQYNTSESWILHSSEPFDAEASSLIASSDYEYAYYIDLDANEIVTMKISSDSKSVEEIGRTALAERGMDTLALSDSGTNLIAYDEDNASSLMILRTTR